MALSITRLLAVGATVCAAATFACGAASGDASKDSGKKKPAAPAASTPASSGSTVAMVGDKAITVDELDSQAAGALFKVRQQEYEARKQVLDGMINDAVLDKEAAAKGVPKEKLMDAEVNSKVTDPAQKEIDDWFEQNKARLGGQTKEQVGPQVTAMLKNQKLQDTQRSYLKGLRDKYGVKVILEPPRIEVAQDDDPSKGPAKAPVTIVEFSDYQCPFCSKAEGTVQDVLKKYGDKIRLVYRDYPLSFHQNAHTAAEASECAKEQGKFWEMHDAMFANQQKLAATDLVETASGIGIDKAKFKTCLDSGKFKTEVDKDFQDGSKYGVTGTPTFFINGIMMVGARDTQSFADIIDQELERRK